MFCLNSSYGTLIEVLCPNHAMFPRCRLSDALQIFSDKAVAECIKSLGSVDPAISGGKLPMASFTVTYLSGVCVAGRRLIFPNSDAKDQHSFCFAELHNQGSIQFYEICGNHILPIPLQNPQNRRFLAQNVFHCNYFRLYSFCKRSK